MKYYITFREDVLHPSPVWGTENYKERRKK